MHSRSLYLLRHSLLAGISIGGKIRLDICRAFSTLLCLVVITFVWTVTAQSEEIRIWEYSPYDVQILVHFTPQVSESTEARTWLMHQVESRLQNVFRAAWNVQLQPMPFHLKGNFRFGLKDMSISDLSKNDSIIALSSTHSATRTIRTAQAAVDQLDSIYVAPEIRQSLLISARQFDLGEQSWTEGLIQRLRTDNWTNETLIEKLLQGEIPAAVAPRSQLPEDSEQLRLLTTPIPWQSDALINERDKVFFLWIDYAEDRYRMEVCEIDCPTRVIGPVVDMFASNWGQVANHASHMIQRAFAPTARVETSDANSAVLLHRAGGLIVDGDVENPARIRVGDVMQPVIRRDDRNGVPTLLQPLKFTFAAVTESDGIRLQANVYTYSGGPGLRGRQNARTQRFLLRVRPLGQEGELQVSVRGNPQQVQSGVAVFDRPHLSEEFNLIGRTDWQGKVPIHIPEQPLFILPARLQAERSEQIRQARQRARDQAQKLFDEAVRQAEQDGRDPPGFPEITFDDNEIAVDPSAQIALNTPLLMLYVKSGEQVLARLPFVPGLTEIEVAELPDDNLRLQTEAFVRGFQGEVLDLIGQRNLMAARVRLHLQRGNLEGAKLVMNQLRELRNFTEMNDQLSRLQRSILEQTTASTSRSSQAAIDRMFKATRDMLQKYLQDETVAETARLLREAADGINRNEESLEGEA